MNVDKIWNRYIEHPELLDKGIEGRRKNYPIIKYVLKHSKKDDLILDLGCGHSVDACLISQKNRRVVGLDSSKSAIEASKITMKKTNANISLVVGNVKNLPFKKDSFDLVFTVGVLQYFKSLYISIKELKNIIKKSGKLLVQVPYKYSSNVIQKRIRIFLGIWPWGWETEYSFSRLKKIFEENTFKVIDFFKYNRINRLKLPKKILDKFPLEICIIGKKL